MKKLLVPFCLTFIVFIGSVGVSASADFDKGLKAYKSGDYASALREWKPLAEQGDAAAQSNLGWMYEKGLGVPQEYKTAVKWYKLAAEQGNVNAQTNLGLMYDNGTGVQQDYKTAVKWYTLAAEQGDASAQGNLGFMYYAGQGVKKSYINAYEWFSKAADQGDKNAAKNLRVLKKEMTPSQLKKARVLADPNADKKQLSKLYQKYILVKECNKINSLYISRNDLKTAKRSIKTIEKMFKKDNKNLNTDAIWNSASKTFDKDMGQSIKMMKLAGVYQPQMRGTCKMALMVLDSVPSEKGNNTRKKDF